MAKNFVVYTRGRTGSTAIREDLNGHPEIVCYGELFTPKMAERLRENFRTDPPTYDFFKKRVGDGNKEKYGRYLRQIIERASRQKPDAIVGFKLLNTQARAQKRQRLLRTLSREGFVFLHLVRRNRVRQAVSAMVARKRGAFNRRNWSAASESYVLDIKDFMRKVNRYSRVAENNKALLSDRECLEIYYEDFYENRCAFYAGIFEFLGVEEFELAPSEFSIMTDRNLRNVVKNFEELREATRTLGLEHMLDAP